MALINHTFPSFTFLNFTNNSLLSPNSSFFVSTQRFKLLSLSATPPSSSSSSPSIFLPFLEEEEEEEKIKQSSLEKEQNEKIPNDPIYKFFKSRTSTQDPPRESKLTLQSNRRTSWHLADNMEEPETGVEIEPLQEEVEVGLDEVAVNESIVMEVMEMARGVPENSTLGEMLSGYEGRVGEAECVEVLRLMIEESMMMNCLYFYEWMGLQEPPVVTPRACTVLFPALGRCRMGGKLMVLWRNLADTWEFKDVHVYNAAMSGLLCSGRYQDAWEVYEAMEMNNVLPDRVTGSIMITVMRKEGKSAKDAWAFFERMNRKGVNWSLEAVGALIKTFCDERLLKQALIIQGEMEKKGISSNTIVYNTLMDAHCKSNMLEEAEALFVEMKNKGLSPTTATYNILMDAYSKRMQPEVVEDLLEEMQETGLEPNVISYTSLISAYGRQKRMSDMAADAFLRMKKAGIKPNSHSYTALVHAYSVSGWHEKAYKAFENMQREGIQPTIETYTALLDAFRRAGDVQTIKDIWKTMIREKIEGTRVTFNILLDGFAKQGHYVEARDVICEFGKIGYQPTVITYNMLINAYARGGQHLKLPQLLKEMAALDLKPDSVTYATMIYAFVRVRDFKRAFYYHKQMVKSGQVPDVESYRKLRSILDVKAAVKNKKDKTAILGIINSRKGMVKAKRKGKKDEFWKNKKKNIRFHNPDHVEQ